MAKKKKQKKVEIKKTNFRSSLLVLAVLVGLLTIFYGIYLKVQSKPVVESPKTEQKKIPEAVRFSKPKPDQAFKIPILMYHYVEYVTDDKDTIRKSLSITPYTFEQEVKTLSEANYTFLTANELADILDGEKQLPEKPVLLTFDDGHWDLDTVVLPILKKYDAKATAYIVPGFLGGSDFLTETQLKDVIDSGLIEIGAHTVHHVSLKGKFMPLVQDEVLGSKQILEKKFAFQVTNFAYPNGSFDDQAIQVVKKAGFRTAVSTIPGNEQSSNNRYFLFRLRPGGRVGESLLNYLDTAKL